MAIFADLAQDVRYALRQLRRSPLFALTATLSLAVGIGANAALFTLVDRLLWRPLPVAHPEELVVVTDQRSRVERSPRYSYPFYSALADSGSGLARGAAAQGAGSLRGVAAHFGLPLNVSIAGAGAAARVNGELVSGSYFPVLGAGIQRGRPLTADDDRTPGAHAVAVISDGYWRRGFAADPLIVGRDIRLNGHIFTIVGVATRGFTGTDTGHPADVWVPLAMQREVGRDLLTDARTNWLEIVGRLTPGASLDRASAELRATHRELFVRPLTDGGSRVQPQIAAALRVLFALAGLALLMACVNVASLLVVRSSAREKEMAVRLALGARRSRMIAQSVTETLVLAGIGGAAGVTIAPWVAGMLVASYPVRLGIETALDARVLLFGAFASVLTGLAVGLPSIVASRKIDFTSIAAPAMRTSSASATSRSSSSMHQMIVAIQIALSLVLLIGAGLFVQSLRGLSAIDPGFDMNGLLVMSVDPRGGGYSKPRIQAFWRDALARVRQAPGVEHASLARIVPLGQGRERRPLTDPSTGATIEIDANTIGSDYFRSLGVPLLRGRDFDDRDDRDARRVIIINERLASMFWPGQDPVGKGLRIDRPGSPEAVVVGVASDVKYRDLREAALPMFYMPIAQSTTSDSMTLHVRTSGDPSARALIVRGELQALDGNLPLFEITTLAERIYASMAETRQAALVSGGFGLIALLLSALGVYGVTALAISRQTHAIGIRMALGAEPRHIMRVGGGRGLLLIVAGLVAGLAAAPTFTRLSRALLYGIDARDPATFGVMAGVLAVTSVIAIAVPIYTATRLDVLNALRSE
jgi:macrolide transport system ATP-binding/permease protein